MEPVIHHNWALSEMEALDIQKELAQKVITHDSFNKIGLVAGVDVAYQKSSHKLVAAAVILDADTLDVVEKVAEEDIEQFPYIPGLFSFREIPPLVKVFKKLQHKPDLIVCDGQGYAHPRRFGLACHLGVIFDIPTIGCGKTRLIGTYDEPNTIRGEVSPLFNENEIIGSVLRTQNNVNPIYVSIGHRISLETACGWILKLAPKYRLPETTRLADQLVNQYMKEILQ
ncbi:deoxyribonuclease V [Vibrio gazogenes]|uniref:Endonuclease V n=1 Tax=Vibrio gazogenes TaxID=687 RepID=A0A1Z2SM40_VIBGA|nr:deoxyribonuclease V [Vibrio gazogenes]ASA58209.1 endonuclease V [Vibrio gazogenes]